MQSHRFPNPRVYMKNFDKWVKIIGDDLHTMDPNVVYSKKRVCSVHFTENDGSPGTNRLKCNVVPTLHMPIPSSNPDAKNYKSKTGVVPKANIAIQTLVSNVKLNNDSVSDCDVSFKCYFKYCIIYIYLYFMFI